MNRLLRMEWNCVDKIALTILTCLVSGCAFIGGIGAVEGPSYAPMVNTPEESGVIYFYKALSYGRGEYPLVINERVITVLKKGGYYPYVVKPGPLQITLIKHEWSPSQLASGAITAGVGGLAAVPGTVLVALIPDMSESITLDIQPGHIYYVKERDGAAAGLDIVNQEQALGEIEKCKLLPAYIGEKK